MFRTRNTKQNMVVPTKALDGWMLNTAATKRGIQMSHHIQGLVFLHEWSRTGKL